MLLKELMPDGFIQILKNRDLNTCARIFIPVVVVSINFYRRARCQKKSPGQGPSTMTMTASTAQKTQPAVNAATPTITMAVVKTDPKAEPAKEPSLEQRIHKVENLQLLVNKRAKLVQTRNELEKFQISSNDFNCSMQMKDSDGNNFTTSFTPGIKKVIEFLRTSFDASIKEVEAQIRF